MDDRLPLLMAEVWLFLSLSFIPPVTLFPAALQSISTRLSPPIVTRHLFCVVQSCLLNRPSLLLDTLASLLFFFAQLETRLGPLSGAISVRSLKCRSTSAIPLIVPSNDTLSLF